MRFLDYILDQVIYGKYVRSVLSAIRVWVLIELSLRGLASPKGGLSELTVLVAGPPVAQDLLPRWSCFSRGGRNKLANGWRDRGNLHLILTGLARREKVIFMTTVARQSV